MNWNDNVNTQDGHKVKLVDFIKTASGASDLVEIFKSPRLVKLTGHYEGESSMDESFEFNSSDYGIDVSKPWCAYCMCFALDNSGNASYTPVMIGYNGNDHPGGYSSLSEGEVDVEEISGTITVNYHSVDGFTEADVVVLMFVMGGK